jgi:hypothetical protein
VIDDQAGRSKLVAVKQAVADQTELCRAPHIGLTRLFAVALMREPLSQHLTCRAAWSTFSFARFEAHTSLIKRASAFPCLPP